MGDSTAMTIEFLRARLLSERTVSKAAKERADQLAKRVTELEERLRVMTIQRRKAEQAAVDAISILETHGINDLFEEIDSSSDKDESPCGEEGCEEASKEDEVCTASKVERMVVEDAQSSSELEVSFSQARSLSWRSRSSSPDSARKLKGKHFRQRQRRMSLMSPVESSPKYNLGKSCRKIKQKEMGSTTEEKGDDFVIIGNSLPGLPVIVSGSQSSFVTVQKQEVDAIGSERDKEMERVLTCCGTTMSKKDCGNHGEHKRHKLFRQLFAAFLLLVIVALLVVLIVWLVLRPTKPKFYLQDTRVVQLNLTTGVGLLTSVFQITLSSRNPNGRIGVYYDRNAAYVLYKGQQITAATALPPGYQGANDVIVWSPYLFGAAVPLAPYLAEALYQDKNAGYILLYLHVDGRLRWKVGTWISDHYHLQVNCPVFLTVDSSNHYGDGPVPYFHFRQMTSCTVDV